MPLWQTPVLPLAEDEPRDGGHDLSRKREGEGESPFNHVKTLIHTQACLMQSLLMQRVFAAVVAYRSVFMPPVLLP